MPEWKLSFLSYFMVLVSNFWVLRLLLDFFFWSFLPVLAWKNSANNMVITRPNNYPKFPMYDVNHWTNHPVNYFSNFQPNFLSIIINLIVLYLIFFFVELALLPLSPPTKKNLYCITVDQYFGCICIYHLDKLGLIWQMENFLHSTVILE